MAIPDTIPLLGVPWSDFLFVVFAFFMLVNIIRNAWLPVDKTQVMTLLAPADNLSGQCFLGVRVSRDLKDIASCGN